MVDLLNRFFAVIGEEVHRHHGLVNKFEGDAALAVFGAPNHLDHPEDEALAASRAIARRIRDEVPECEAGIGAASGEAVAGNVGAKERFEYTVIGEPVPLTCSRHRRRFRTQAKALLAVGLSVTQ